MSRESTRLPRRPSGTSSLMIRCASPSTMAVLPTPGSPISTGLFLVRRWSTWITRRISSSRPMTGSSLPSRARSVRSMVYFFSASRWPSASWECTVSEPRTALIASSRAAGFAPLALSRRPSSPLSFTAASRKSSEAMNWSPRLVASLSVRFSRLLRSREMPISPPCPSTFGRRLIASSIALRSGATFTPARCRSEAVLPSSWARRAERRCCGSM